MCLDDKVTASIDYRTDVSLCLALSFAALNTLCLAHLHGPRLVGLRRVPPVGLDDGKQKVLLHELGEAIRGNDGGVDPTA